MLRRKRHVLLFLCIFIFIFWNLYFIEFNASPKAKDKLSTVNMLHNLGLGSIFSSNSLNFHRISNDMENGKPEINPHNIKYLINNGHKICKRESNEEILLLAFIPVLPDRFEERRLIRSTWTDKSLFPEIQHVFIMGNSTEDINLDLKEENDMYGDIIQEEFVENYYNLTLKTLTGLKWASIYCPNAKFVLKVDDDVIVNSFSLIKYLKSFNSSLTNSILCRVWKDPIVNRNESSKFYVSYSEYSGKIWKNYCDGPAYLITGDLVPKLYHRSLSVKSIRFEDVYLGVVADDLNASYVNLTRSYSFKKHWYLDQVQRINHTKYNLRYFIYVNGMQEFITGWDILKEKIVNNYLKF